MSKKKLAAIIVGCIIAIVLVIVIPPLVQPSRQSEAQVHDASTDSSGQVSFIDSSTGETVMIHIKDSGGNALTDINVQYWDYTDAEMFIAEDPSGEYATSLDIYPHNSEHLITMHISSDTPIVTELSTSSEQGKATENIVEHAQNEWVYIGKRTPEQLDKEDEVLSAILAYPLKGLMYILSTAGKISKAVGKVSDWEEPEYYHVYRIVSSEGLGKITTSVYTLVPEWAEEPPTETGRGQWSSASSMLGERSNFEAMLLKDGTVFVFGGRNSEGTGEIYDPSADRWSSVDNPIKATTWCAAALMGNGKVLVAALTYGEQKTGAEIFDPSNGTWSLAPGLGNRYTSVTTMVTLNDGRPLLLGSCHYHGFRLLPNTQLYEPALNEWYEGEQMLENRYDHTATVLQDGRVLISGGQLHPLDGYHYVLSSAEIYDPVEDMWTSAGRMSEVRIEHRAVLLKNGVVLVTGGAGSDGALSSAEVYDPSTNTWSNVPPMHVGRKLHTASLLEDGRVLVTGGRGEDRGSAEVFDPENNEWILVDSMEMGRADHAAVVLNDGRVLVMGGYEEYGGIGSSCEIFTP